MSTEPLNSPDHPVKEWHHGFDWLRAIFIICILLMHLNFTQVLAGSRQEITLYDLLQYNVLCVAVPGFFLLSSYLISDRCRTVRAYGAKIKGNIALYLFWVGAWVLVTKSYPELTLRGMMEFLLRGGGWAFYFFATLTINSIIGALLHKLSFKIIVIGFMATALITQGTFHALAAKNHAWTQVDTYWWPVCFLSIPFLGAILSRIKHCLTQNNARGWIVTISALVLTIAFALVEWHFAAAVGSIAMRPFLPEYMRISLVFGAACLLIFGLKISYSPWIVKWISKNSLGIFCLHVFMLSAVAKKVQSQFPHQAAAPIITVIAVIGICGCVAEVMRRLLKERVI